MLKAGAVGARQMSGTGMPAGAAAVVVTGRMAPPLTGSALTAAECPPTQAWLPWTAGYAMWQDPVTTAPPPMGCPPIA